MITGTAILGEKSYHTTEKVSRVDWLSKAEPFHFRAYWPPLKICQKHSWSKNKLWNASCHYKLNACFVKRFLGLVFWVGQHSPWLVPPGLWPNTLDLQCWVGYRTGTLPDFGHCNSTIIWACSRFLWTAFC